MNLLAFSAFPEGRKSQADFVPEDSAAKINVTALDAVSVHGRFGAIFWVAPKDLKKAMKVVGVMSAAPDAVSAAIATMGV